MKKSISTACLLLLFLSAGCSSPDTKFERLAADFIGEWEARGLPLYFFSGPDPNTRSAYIPAEESAEAKALLAKYAERLRQMEGGRALLREHVKRRPPVDLGDPYEEWSKDSSPIFRLLLKQVQAGT